MQIYHLCFGPDFYPSYLTSIYLSHLYKLVAQSYIPYPAQLYRIYCYITERFFIIKLLRTMAFDPRIHHRRSIRLKGYDYSREGAYFITICCEDRKNRFGYIENEKMVLNELGIIAYNEWVALGDRFANVELDVFQIMPNHMHAILVIVPVGATFTVAQNGNDGADDTIANSGTGTGASPVPTSVRTATVGDIVGAYKSLVSNECLKIFKTKNKMMGRLWQRNYYEIIIRNDQSYQNISDYIINNPAKWQQDKFHEK